MPSSGAAQPDVAVESGRENSPASTTSEIVAKYRMFGNTQIVLRGGPIFAVKENDAGCREGFS